ncbi:MAG: hypothetical protein R2843_10610 [Thermomicrobiales bacterium]
MVWGSMNTTRSYARLMYQDDLASTTDNAIIVRSGETLGGGSTVNIDLAFSPLESTVQARINTWIEDGLMSPAYSTEPLFAAAYDWVRTAIGTRTLGKRTQQRQPGTLGGSGCIRRRSLALSPEPLPRSVIRHRRSMTSSTPDVSSSTWPLPTPRIRSVSSPTRSSMRCCSTIPACAQPGCGCMTTPWTEYGNTVVDPSNSVSNWTCR